MKVTGALIALAAAAPLASAIPFKMADFLAPMARAPARVPDPEPVPAPEEHPVFPQLPATNLTTRSLNETESPFSKRAFVPQGSEDKSKRSYHNGIEDPTRRTNITFKA